MGRAVSALRSQEEMLKAARRFIEKAAEILDVVEAYIVGSRARGDYLDTSDIDIVIIARRVENLNQKQRIMMLADLAEPGVDYRVYTPEEWYSGKSTWIKEMRKEAVKIYPHSHDNQPPH